MVTSTRLISYSQPPKGEDGIIGIENVQDLIAFCARVSNPANQMNQETSEKLIKYLVKHKHWSPLEMASATIEIDTTRDIAHQIVRHRSFAFQEFSQRYAEPSAMGDAFTKRECRLQDYENRQNSIDDLDYLRQDLYSSKIQHLFDESYRLYNELLEEGVAKECARKILPMNSPTRLYMSGTIRSWIHYLSVRKGPETQLEHRMIANEIYQTLNKEMPNLWEVIN